MSNGFVLLNIFFRRLFSKYVRVLFDFFPFFHGIVSEVSRSPLMPGAVSRPFPICFAHDCC